MDSPARSVVLPETDGGGGAAPDSTNRRDDFAAFLRSRRARLTPADVGLPTGTRRRVNGLRREEVAQLAGVGLTWYTWLEQGRPIAASVQVLSSIARALRLTPDESEHLYALAGVSAPEGEVRSCMGSAHLDLIHKLLPYPVAVLTARFDLLAYNSVYRMLFGDLDDVDPDHRNIARLLFTDRSWKRTHVDLDEAQLSMAARLRSAYGHHRAEPRWQSFVEKMKETSAGFGRIWDDGEVAGERNRVYRFRNGHVGDLVLSRTSMWLDHRFGTRLVWFAPMDAPSRERLELLARTSGEPTSFRSPPFLEELPQPVLPDPLALASGKEAHDGAMRRGRRPLGDQRQGASPIIRGRVPESDRALFDQLIEQTGKKESELVRVAVRLLIDRYRDG